jgi:alkyl sulfatase BDS1-like metallo-beta-lactamase superfamily hydrolase
MRTRLLALALAASFVSACGGEKQAAPAGAQSEAGAPDENGFTAPTPATTAANASFASNLALGDPQDFEDASRGLIAREPDMEIPLPNGRSWSQRDFAFIDGEPPPSVNPSLWRQGKLNNLHGLYEVTDGIYQVRGYDLANMSWIRGETGWIVVDPLTSVESAAAAVALARKHLGDDPVVAVIFTHSHIDHFAGVRSVLPDGSAEGVRIVAPRHFVEEVTSENVFAGTAMGRRASYQFGSGLPLGPRGHVDSGLGKQPVRAHVSLAIPDTLIDQTPQPLAIDGVPFVFQYAPESEAPAELAFYLPGQQAYGGAEIVSHNMHNLYTLRGAKVRDALKWSGYIDDAIQRFSDVELVFQSHHWPVFGNERSLAFLKGQRDTYRYIHDQTLRLANQGATSREIAERLRLPRQLARSFANRGYYGTLRHNSKAVYQFYFGWYDANPANLDPLPPRPLGVKYVAAMGGAAAVKEQARTALTAGEYRWAATLLDHLVFAESEDDEARELLAQAYDQLGYQAESGVWRSVYLTGAHELRHGTPTGSGINPEFIGDILAHIPTNLFFASMATRVNGPKAAQEEDMSINFVFTDVGETYVIALENAVLHHWQREADPDAAATVTLTREMFLKMGTGQVGLRDFIFSDELNVDGSRMALLRFFGLLDPPDPDFAIVTP